MGKYFGTGGIRGRADAPPLTYDWVKSIGLAIGSVCQTRGKEHILIGRDTRQSGHFIEEALSYGLLAAGASPLLAGVTTTPAAGFLTVKHNCSAGIVISASHNPYEDNGIKIFGQDGRFACASVEKAIETRLDELGDSPPLPECHDRHPDYLSSASREYVDFCCSALGDRDRLSGLKAVIDCANGAASVSAPDIFTRLGINCIMINNQPDGRNINLNCGSEDTAALSQAVRAYGADVGIGFDGDADRLAAVDENGERIRSESLIYILALHMKRRGRLKGDFVATTPMSNCGLRNSLAAHGIECLNSEVGEKHVLELMLSRGVMLGGERSGHMLVLDRHTTGCGEIAAIELLCALKDSGGPASGLDAGLLLYPHADMDIEVGCKVPFSEIKGFREAEAEIKELLDGKGRTFVRYSGTEQVCRIIVEADSIDTAERAVGILRNVISNGTSKAD